MTELQLVERACETLQGYLALGNERFQAHSATFIRNRAMPARHDANHVGLVRTNNASEIDSLIAVAEAEYSGIRHRFDMDPLTPPEVEARLALAGYRSWGSGLHLVLVDQPRGAPKPFDIREIVDERGWQDFDRLVRDDHTEEAKKHGRELDLNSMPQRLAYVKAKSPEVRFWLAFVDGEAVAYLNSWPGENGVGQVEDLFTHPDYRHRGIATALLAHSIQDARDRGAGSVVISADPDDTPKEMYAALGFRPLFVSRSYVKRGGR